MNEHSDWTPRIDPDKKLPKRTMLAEAIISAIDSGELPYGFRLPTHRELAHRLGYSVQTVSASYQEVQRRGYIRSVVGSGSIVIANNPGKDGNFILAPGPSDGADMSTVLPTYTMLHEAASRRMMTALGRADNSIWMSPSRPLAGLPHHRDAAAKWLLSLGVDVPTDQIFLTNGATHAIFVALSVIARPGDVVLTERLTENGIVGAANVLGLSLKGLETDDQGIIPDALDAACRKNDIAALIWIPSLGNPTAHLARAERRREIANIAKRHDIAVIEDEIYKPLLDEELPSISTLLPKKGFFISGFSKSVMAGLRVGYLTAPAPFAMRVASVLRSTTWSVAPLLAEIASRWIGDGTAEQLINAQREEANARQEILAEHLAPHIASTHRSALSAWLEIPSGWDENTLVALLRERQILVTPSAPFKVTPDSPEAGIRICLSSPPTHDALVSALKQIKTVFDQLPAMDFVHT